MDSETVEPKKPTEDSVAEKVVAAENAITGTEPVEGRGDRMDDPTMLIGLFCWDTKNPKHCGICHTLELPFVTLRYGGNLRSKRIVPLERIAFDGPRPSEQEEHIQRRYGITRARLRALACANGLDYHLAVEAFL